MNFYITCKINTVATNDAGTNVSILLLYKWCNLHKCEATSIPLDILMNWYISDNIYIFSDVTCKYSLNMDLYLTSSALFM